MSTKSLTRVGWQMHTSDGAGTINMAASEWYVSLSRGRRWVAAISGIIAGPQ